MMWRALLMLLVIVAVIVHVGNYGIWLTVGIILAALELREVVNR